MNKNLKCTYCDNFLIQSSCDKLFYICNANNCCYKTNLLFLEDLDTSYYYNIYIEKNSKLYHIYSKNKKSKYSYYTQLSLVKESQLLPYNYLLKLDEIDFNITSSLPIKNQAEKILNKLLNLAIFK